MSTATPRSALLTVSIGPVQTFIAQARRIADLWTGSHLLSHLVARAVTALPEGSDSVVFPSISTGDGAAVPPGGLPNRFVARVPEADASNLARSVTAAVAAAWRQVLDEAEEALAPHGLAPTDPVLRPNAELAFEVAWSWVPERNGYGQAAEAGASRFAASRHYRPFVQRESGLEKCAICGERTALPDGHRGRVRQAWSRTEEATRDTADEGLFRFDQTRLCLVCAAKRLYVRPEERRIYFRALEQFQPGEDRPYFALVQLDGDRMGHILGWGAERLRERDAEAFHRAVSRGLYDFARQLSSHRPPDLDVAELGIDVQGRHRPQLIYAGGDDVLLVCDPRDGIPVARAIRERYRSIMGDHLRNLLEPEDLAQVTLSGAMVIAHTRQPAGLTLRDAARLLKVRAKGSAGRDALAVRLDKRGGIPVETDFRWDDGPEDGGETWLQAMDHLVDDLRSGRLSSGRTFDLRREEQLLRGVFERHHWAPWLSDRLSRTRGTVAAEDQRVAERIASFFIAGKAEALRIVRFLGRELETGAELKGAS